MSVDRELEARVSKSQAREPLTILLPPHSKDNNLDVVKKDWDLHYNKVGPGSPKAHRSFALTNFPPLDVWAGH